MSVTRQIAIQPSLTPAQQFGSEEKPYEDNLSVNDRAAAEVLIKHLFSNAKHRIKGIEYDVAYQLAAGAVGGDIVDVYDFDNGNVSFSIADISGKGIQAAVHAALVKYGLRCFASQGLSPERVLRSLDRVYIETNAFERTESFATVFTAVVDASRLGLTYASAGHEPVVIMFPDGQTRVLPPTAPIIGVFDDQHHLFKQRFIATPAGTILVGGTDGITEARNSAGHFFGIDGFSKVIRECAGETPAVIVETILSSVRAFAGRSVPDDRALFAVQINQP